MKADRFAIIFSLLLGSSQVALASGGVWIDVRTAEEFAAGHVPGAINIPHERIASGITRLELDKNQPIYLYCRSGRRAGIAMDDLRELGYRQVENIGGLEDARKLEAVKDPAAGE